MQLSTSDFTQIGSEVTITVGRDGAFIYDPIHGTTLFIPRDSLPVGTSSVEITRKSGFNTCSTLHPSMQGCSATVCFECCPPILFTKDVHIEIPHCFVSYDTSGLCFVKYDDGMDSTGYGEMLSGLFPPEYPYGVIAVRSFSAYRISTKKRVGLKLARKLVTKSIFNPQILCLQVKSANSINGLSTKKECISKWSVSCADSNTPKSYWLGINENSDKRTVSISLSHCTPTGYEVIGYMEMF